MTWKRASSLLTLSVAFLTGCNVMGSTPVFDEQSVSYGTCKSRLGAYTLPKTVVRLTVSKTAGQKFYQIENLSEERVPDTKHSYCLDHLANGFASDSIRVVKGTTETRIKFDAKDSKLRRETTADVATPYLQIIGSLASDESAEIIRKLIRTVFILLSGNPEFETARQLDAGATAENKTIAADLRFDPFDQVEVAEVNQTLRHFGFCAVFGDYSFNTAAASASEYCSAPQRINNRHPSAKAVHALRQKSVTAARKNGIFYRPRADYRLAVYAKTDPGSVHPWRLALLENISLENISPVLSVGVGRAAFAQRRTGLIFDNGVLRHVCVAKGSEAAGFINIPLDVVYGVIALPSQSIKAAINSTNTRRRLVEAEERLIAAQNAYIEFLADKDRKDPIEFGADEKGKVSPGTLKLGINDSEGNPVGVPGASAADDFTLEDRGLDGNTGSLNEDKILESICAELLQDAANSIFSDGDI